MPAVGAENRQEIGKALSAPAVAQQNVFTLFSLGGPVTSRRPQPGRPPFVAGVRAPRNSADAWHSGNWPNPPAPPKAPTWQLKSNSAAMKTSANPQAAHRGPPPGRPSRQRESREIGPRRNPRRPRAQHGKSLTAARRPPARQSLRQGVLQVRPNDELIHQPPPDSLQHDVQMGGAKA